MTRIRIVLAVLALALAAAATASAQRVLRIGLNDDPDALDPTISRAYVGRLVFAARLRQALRRHARSQDRARSSPPATSGRADSRSVAASSCGPA